MDINIPGFIAAILPVALSPGASLTLAMNNAFSGGARGLAIIITGTALGIYSHALLIGLGVTALLIRLPAFFIVLKVAGTLYLLWLGIQLIRSGIRASTLSLSHTGSTLSIRQAWLANIINPKAVILYLTVVSQFAGAAGHLSHYLILASIHVFIMSLWLLLASKVLVSSASKVNTQRLTQGMNIGGGALLILFALLNAMS